MQIASYCRVCYTLDIFVSVNIYSLIKVVQKVKCCLYEEIRTFIKAYNNTK